MQVEHALVKLARVGCRRVRVGVHSTRLGQYRPETKVLLRMIFEVAMIWEIEVGMVFEIASRELLGFPIPFYVRWQDTGFEYPRKSRRAFFVG